MKMTKIATTLVLLSLCLFTGPLMAQGWLQTYQPGYAALTIAREALPTDDGGYIAVGDISLPTGAPRDYIRLWKVDANGSLQWDKVFFYGDIRLDHSNSILPHPEGGYFVLGTNNALDAIVGENMWLLRVDAFGDTLWARTYATASNYNTAADMVFTQDGKLLLAGSTYDGVDSTSGAYLVKIGLDGTPIWEKEYQWHSLDITPTLSEIKLLDDGGFIATGAWAHPATPAVIRFDALGDTLWTKTYAFSTGDELWDIEPTPDGGFIVCGQASGFAGINPIAMKLDAAGNEQWQQIYDVSYAKAVSICPATNGGYVLAGSLDNYIWYPAAPAGFMLKINENGAEQWRHALPDSLGGYSRLSSIEPAPDGGYIAAGEARWISMLIKTDSLGNSITNVLKGNLYNDANHNCSYDVGEDSLAGWKLVIQGDGPDQYATTDSNGQYSITLDTGTYIITVLPPNALWEPCVPGVAVQLQNFYDTTVVDMAMQPGIDCPLMQVDVSTPFLRRCFENQYTVQYCNEGTTDAVDAAVEVELDPHLSLTSAELPFQNLGNNRYRFEIGTVPYNSCGDLKFTAYLDCDNTVLGQTHCVEAFIFPDTLCQEPANSTPIVEVEAGCTGDSVYFILRNIGIVDMAMPADYIVIEDDVMYLPRPFNLDAGDTVRVTEPANGSTYRLEAPQQPSAGGGLVSATVEGCGLNAMGAFSIGYVNQFPLYSGSSFIDIECRESIGSYDPNDKQALPRGYGSAHFVKPGTAIEYLVRFQNTGTDTAFTVVVRDTLSPWLSPGSVRPGASSHPYTWSLSGEGILTFTFAGIMLPDSSTNEAASHGFIKFMANQRPGNPLDAVIENQAGIYFDYNAPVLTNTVFHTLGENFVQISNTPEIPEEPARLSVRVAPNPASDWATFLVEGMQNTTGDFLLYHSNGALALRHAFQGNQFGLDMSQLPGGVYFFRLEANGKRLGSGKLVVGRP
ncbi:MAG: DUF11 domain-containing protein [Phaeodactylibacter sp.]|nr:DUF11 domain-containing protein [Phaeodactylibacter sp.]MCB9277186.1 DUF11 domain-containing protein [Lewinellaceae bacterium]